MRLTDKAADAIKAIPALAEVSAPGFLPVDQGDRRTQEEGRTCGPGRVSGAGPRARRGVGYTWRTPPTGSVRHAPSDPIAAPDPDGGRPRRLRRRDRLEGARLLADPSIFPPDDFVEYWAAGSLNAGGRTHSTRPGSSDSNGRRPGHRRSGVHVEPAVDVCPGHAHRRARARASPSSCGWPPRWCSPRGCGPAAGLCTAGRRPGGGSRGSSH